MAIVGYAQITPDLNTIIKRRPPSNPPTLGPTAPGKAYWVPIELVEIDNSTGPDKISDFVQTIAADKVTRTITTRDKTAQELDDDDNNTVSSLSEIGALDRAIFEFLFDHENRIRVLENRPIITKQQAFNLFRAKLRS